MIARVSVRRRPSPLNETPFNEAVAEFLGTKPDELAETLVGDVLKARAPRKASNTRVRRLRMVHAPDKDRSVYDFLYVDSQRIALFLSQLEQYGHLKALTRSVGENKRFGGGFDVKIVGANVSTGEDSSLKTEYDPQWVAPLTFLEEADKRGMIHRDIAKARIGKLLLISGQLAMLGFSILKSAWDSDFIRDLVRGGRAGDLSKAQENFVFESIKQWPHLTQVLLTGGGASVWGTINDGGLITPASDLLLKHGVIAAGEWKLLGVLDAMPASKSPKVTTQTESEKNAVPSSLVGTLFSRLAPMVKQALGRPKTAFGVTPLLIFREVSG